MIDVKNMEMWKLVALILLIIGGLNWGFVGLLGLNLIAAIFGNLLARLIEILVGVAAGYMIYLWVKKRQSTFS